MRNVVTVGLLMLEVVGWAASAPAQSASPSSAPLGSEGDLQALRERAAAFWTARVAGDFQAQWELLEPRGRARMTPQEYAGDRGSVRYLAHQIEGATANGFFGIVKVRVLFRPIPPPSATSRSVPAQASVVDDGWVRIGGVWYRRVDSGEDR